MEFGWKWQWVAWPEFRRAELWGANHWHVGMVKIRFGRNWNKRSKAGGFRGEEFWAGRLESWDVLWQKGP